MSAKPHPSSALLPLRVFFQFARFPSFFRPLCCWFIAAIYRCSSDESNPNSYGFSLIVERIAFASKLAGNPGGLVLVKQSAASRNFLPLPQGQRMAGWSLGFFSFLNPFYGLGVWSVRIFHSTQPTETTRIFGARCGSRSIDWDGGAISLVNRTGRLLPVDSHEHV